MINRNDYIKIGSFKRKFGKNNDLILGLTVNFDVFSIVEDTLFLDLGSGDLLPIFPSEYFEKPPEELRVHFEIPYEGANFDFYLNKDVYLPKNLIPEDLQKISDFDLKGWKVSCEKNKFSAVVNDIVETKQQTLLIVYDGKAEFMIPFHEDLICSVNFDDKSVVFDLPDGLLDIN